jgi:hypothetical protein
VWVGIIKQKWGQSKINGRLEKNGHNKNLYFLNYALFWEYYCEDILQKPSMVQWLFDQSKI